MASLDLKLLAARLSNHSRRALEAAASITLTRTNYNVEIEHWLLKILEDQETDIISLIRHFDINQGQIEIELLRVLDSLRTGNARPPSLSPDLITIMEQAWLLASIEQNGTVIRSSHLLWAMLNEQRLAWHIKQSIPSLDVIQAGDIKQRFPVLLADSKEGAHAASLPLPAPSAAAAPGSSGSLSQFTINLTAQARSGKIEPIFGRDTEIRQMIDILARHRQNNPILTGEPGVGKTAIVEGFAVRLANGEVPPTLRNVELLILDLGLLQAGSGVKGEFENRLRSIIDEVNASPKPVILFVDEAHTLIGAGGSAGQNDAANLLKPALARGELKVIAATTWAEYKKYFEKDAALARRFQVIKVEEPTETVATSMIRSMVPPLEQHHNIRIFDEAVTAAVRLSARYIPNRQLPDKAVSLLDTACARVAMSQSTIPPSIEDLQRRISLADTELATLERETSAGKSHDSRIATLQQERQTAEVALSSLEAQ